MAKLIPADLTFSEVRHLPIVQKAQDNNVKFVTRLPATYKECGRAIADAVAAHNWIDFGKLNKTPATLKRPAANYRGFKTTVELYDRPYRAIVVHSSAHDKRRHKRIDRLLVQNEKSLKRTAKRSTRVLFIAVPMPRLLPKKSQRPLAAAITACNQINKVAKYPRGRPAKAMPRTPLGYEYLLDIRIDVDTDALSPLRLEAGCFILICN